MTEEELDQLEATIPEMAVQALTNAHRRARASGQDVVMVVDDKLVRIGPHGTTVLKSLPYRVKVNARTKRATT